MKRWGRGRGLRHYYIQGSEHNDGGNTDEMGAEVKVDSYSYDDMEPSEETENRPDRGILRRDARKLRL